MTKRVQWFIYNGEILEADYMNNLPEPKVEDNDDIDPESLPWNWARPKGEPPVKAFVTKEFDVDLVQTFTGEVLYIGHEDAVVHDYVLRQIKFIVKDSQGLVWSLLPAQIRYL